MDATDYESMDIWYRGELIGQLERFPSGWFVWDELTESYIYPNDDHHERWATQHDAMRAFLQLQSARRQIAALAEIIPALSNE